MNEREQVELMATIIELEGDSPAPWLAARELWNAGFRKVAEEQ